MDSEKLIERLRTESLYADKASLEIMDLCMDAATALSTLQAENAQLRADLEYEREHANAYHEECGQWEAENEKLYANLARVTAERDAAQALLAEISGVIGSAPITTAFGIPLDRLRELVEADREQEFQRHLKRFDIMPPKKNALKAREQDG